jgi:hypothetical protein
MVGPQRDPEAVQLYANNQRHAEKDDSCDNYQQQPGEFCEALKKRYNVSEVPRSLVEGDFPVAIVRIVYRVGRFF